MFDDVLNALHEGAARWATLPLPTKAELFRLARKSTAVNASRWAAIAAEVKGLVGTPLEGEESITGPWAVLRGLNAYVKTLREIQRSGTPQIQAPRIRRGSDGRIVVRVFPDGALDRVLVNGVRAEVWMPHGLVPAEFQQTLAPAYRHAPAPRVALVLGAGNITSIAVLDALYKLFADGAACIVKLHPFLRPLQPVFEDCFAPLIQGGYLRFVAGDAAVGSYLAKHSLIDEVHVTGSAATFHALKAELPPGKAVTGELGNVTPTIVVPGRWSLRDLEFQAQHIVSTKLHNAGFNCVAAQVLILPARWEQRDLLLELIARRLREAPRRFAYYPRALERAMVALDATSDGPLFEKEVFCEFLATVSLPGDTAAYLHNAVTFANERLAGNLAANVIAHPRTLRRYPEALQSAIANLRYGCVALNTWSGVAFLLPQVPWGAYPLPDGPAGSGTGVVHNSYLFSEFEKTVLTGPFRPFPPKPIWFVNNRNESKIGAALCDFEGAPRARTLAKIALLALRG